MKLYIMVAKYVLGHLMASKLCFYVTNTIKHLCLQNYSEMYAME